MNAALDHRTRRTWEWSGLAFLGAVVVWLLDVSWRKWPDPMIDFGRELYIPWRLHQGAVLYRDIDANYGPLSHYFNSLVFSVMGVGYMNLVWINLLVYLAILALLYQGVRMGWGPLAAFAGSLIFVTVFSFSQLVGIANYNFLSPYSHETTHGFLLILILIHLWASWLRTPRRWKVVSAGLCFGLCVLLKVEVIFVAVIVTAGAWLIAFLEGNGLRRFRAWLPIALPFLLAGSLPSLFATLLFWQEGGFSLATAFCWANIAWTGLFVYKNIVSDPLQLQLLGVADLPVNLATLVIYGGISVAGVAGLAVLCQRLKPWKRFDYRWILLLAVAGLASFWLPWIEWGVTFPAWLCVALFIALRRRLPEDRPAPAAAQSAGLRWLFLLAAGAFLARMALNPRIYHYGYYQAALAGVVIVASGFRSIPDLFRLQKSARALYLGALGFFLAIGLWKIEERSRLVLNLKTQPVGEGVDQFYGFPANVEAASGLIESARQTLSARADCNSLLVAPEGVMLNYLLRKPVPISAYNFNPYWLNWREKILDGLQKAPPDYVVLISRDMREYGMESLGDSPAHGQAILAWIKANYVLVWRAGGNPLDVKERGVVVLRKTSTAPAR